MTGFYWLASYPKSGSTWLALALSSLCRGGLPVDFSTEGFLFPQAASRESFDRTLGIESSDLTPDEDELLRPQMYRLMASQAGQPLIRRVHAAFVRNKAGELLFPPDLTLGAVCLVRDPRDVAVSYAHYMECDTDTAISAMRNPAATVGARPGALSPLLAQRLLTWTGHVESWLESGLRLLLIRYEDMLTSPIETLSTVASFVGWNGDADAIATAAEASRFDRLQSEEQEHGFESSAFRSGPFFRRGIAGGWRDALAPAQVRQIERDHGHLMGRLGYTLIFEDSGRGKTTENSAAPQTLIET